MARTKKGKIEVTKLLMAAGGGVAANLAETTLINRVQTFTNQPIMAKFAVGAAGAAINYFMPNYEAVGYGMIGHAAGSAAGDVIPMNGIVGKFIKPRQIKRGRIGRSGTFRKAIQKAILEAKRKPPARPMPGAGTVKLRRPVLKRQAPKSLGLPKRPAPRSMPKPEVFIQNRPVKKPAMPGTVANNYECATNIYDADTFNHDRM